MAGRELRITDGAARDLERIRRFICAAGPREATERWLASLDLAIGNIPFTPLASPVNPATGKRERIVGHHIIIYEVTAALGVGPCAGDVTVLAISGPGAAA